MFQPDEYDIYAFVTSHTGCVSRNAMKAVNAFKGIVTSRTGCVSRNDLSNFNTSKVIELYSLKDV